MTLRPKQIPLIKEPRKDTKLWWIVKQTTYGGALNYRKVARPFNSKKLVHAVLMGNVGTALRFTKSRDSIQKLVEWAANKYEIKIKDLAINHDHIHILFYTKLRDSQRNFLRLVAAQMGRKYQSLRKKFGIRNTNSIWRLRPFTRLVGWHKKSLQIVRKYFQKNREEALGFVVYTPRKHRLTRFLAAWSNNLSSA